MRRRVPLPRSRPRRESFRTRRFVDANDIELLDQVLSSGRCVNSAKVASRNSLLSVFTVPSMQIKSITLTLYPGVSVLTSFSESVPSRARRSSSISSRITLLEILALSQLRYEHKWCKSIGTFINKHPSGPEDQGARRGKGGHPASATASNFWWKANVRRTKSPILRQIRTQG